MNILMIAYYFPPDSSSGSFRPLHFARHLTALGEQVAILTAREEDFTAYQTKDALLVNDIPQQNKVARTGVFRPHDAVIKLRDTLLGKPKHAQQAARNVYSQSVDAQTKPSFFQQVKDAITDLLTTPDQHSGWLVSAVNQGRKLIRKQSIDIMFATGRPWTGLLVGTILKKLSGTPLVIDFRDPWVASPIFVFKSPFIRKIETWLERQAVHCADHIIANTETLKQDFLQRYPRLSAEQVTAIPNGFEEYIDAAPQSGSRFTLAHTGTLIFRNPRLLLEATIKLIEQGRIPQEALRLIFLGDFVIEDPELETVLRHPKLEGVVEILPRVPYKEAMQYKIDSDVLFLIQPKEFPLQVPRKLYEYMAVRKPILGITPPDQATGRIIRDNHLGLVVDNQPEELADALSSLYNRWKAGSLTLPANNTCDAFTNRNITQKLLNVFESCLRKGA